MLFSHNPLRKIFSFVINKHEISFVKLANFRKMVMLHAEKDIVRQSHPAFIAKENIIGSSIYHEPL